MMLLFIAAMLARASVAEIPEESWTCANQMEVWCSADGCDAAEPGAFTPMSIAASARGGFSVCAYTGCWEGAGAPLRQQGRILWMADGAAFSTSPDGGMKADVTLLIIEAEGVGFVRVGGFATPLLCERAGPKLTPAAR